MRMLLVFCHHHYIRSFHKRHTGVEDMPIYLQYSQCVDWLLVISHCQYLHVAQTYTVSRKKWDQMFCVIFLIKLKWCWRCCVFCTASLAILPTHCNQLDSNLVIWRPQLRWGKFWSFGYNSVVARVRRAFQVSRCSLETLFRWAGKHLHHFAANLFRKWCTRFC